MKLKIGINGFGRIGRAVFRNNLINNVFDVVCINDINPDIDNLAYILKYDSTYGKLSDKISINNNKLVINDRHINIYNSTSILDTDWMGNNVDVIIDATGVDQNLLDAVKLKETGIKYCVFTNSPNPKNIDKTIIMGVNQEQIDFDNDFLIASSICDANAFVPVAKVLDREYGIEHGFLTTLHPWLGYQNLLDGPSVSYSSPGEIHDHYALGRSSFGTIIPKTTSAIDAACKVMESLEGKFLSFSYRVPTMVVGSADATFKLKDNITSAMVKELFINEEAKQGYKVFYNNTKNLISLDFVGSEYSAIIDHRWIMVNNNNYLKIVLWYDNEWGYSARVVDLIQYIGSNL